MQLRKSPSGYLVADPDLNADPLPGGLNSGFFNPVVG